MALIKNIQLNYNCHIFKALQYGYRSLKSINLSKGILFICITLAIGVLFKGCLNTEGILEIEGKVTDENTKTQLPERNIIVRGLVKVNNKLVPIEAGQFSTDSAGYFAYSFSKIKDAYFYDFNLVGDSDYTFKIRRLGLLELEQNARFLNFTLNKLVDLTIIITRKNKKSVLDTLALYWESNGVSGRNLYPYKIQNYGNTNNYNLTSGTELRWIGKNVSSTVTTKVFADKLTKVHWDLDRDGKRMEFIDTITCRREFSNIVYFTY